MLRSPFKTDKQVNLYELFQKIKNGCVLQYRVNAPYRQRLGLLSFKALCALVCSIPLSRQYQAIDERYSAPLRALVNSMINLAPERRPPIDRVAAYITVRWQMPRDTHFSSRLILFSIGWIQFFLSHLTHSTRTH